MAGSRLVFVPVPASGGLLIVLFRLALVGLRLVVRRASVRGFIVRLVRSWPRRVSTAVMGYRGILMGGHDLMIAASGIGTMRAGVATPVARTFPMILSLISRAAAMHGAAAVELAWSPRGGYFRPAVVYGSELGTFIVSPRLVVPLQGSGLDVAVVFSRQFARRRARANSASPAVVTHAVHGEVVGNRPVVNVGDVRTAEIVHRAVIEEIPAPPLTTDKAPARVAKAVVDAAIEAHMRSPITRVEDEGGSAPTPVARSPQQARLGRHYPGAGNPEVASIGVICPVAGRPHIAGRRARRLRINWDGRRSDAHGNPNGD